MAESTTTERDVRSEIVTAAKEAVPKLREDKAQTYSRLMLDKTTLAYVWSSGKGTTRIDLYVLPSSLPKSVKSFSPARGRARKEGLVAVLPPDPSRRDLEQIAEALKVAAEFASTERAAAATDGKRAAKSDPKPSAKATATA